MRHAAYYFRAHLYTQVPRHVREDLTWMADHGAAAVVLGVIEQDLDAARENIDLICREADRVGMQVWATPSRWGNLVAGCPKVPSILCAVKPECWAQRADGSPWMSFLGPHASIYHPATREVIAALVTRTLTQWPITGLVWDEPKAVHVQDHCPAAKAALGDLVHDADAQRRGQCGFFGWANAIARQAKPEVFLGLFTFAHDHEPLIGDLAMQAELDSFGCDGRPWAVADGGVNDNPERALPSKLLIDAGPRFIEVARRHRRRSLALIENHALPVSCHELMDRRMPEIIAQGWDDLLWYYYPRSCEDPDGAMAILGRHLRRIAG